MFVSYIRQLVGAGASSGAMGASNINLVENRDVPCKVLR
jgi:hypothetical protein